MRSVVNAAWVCLLMLTAATQARDWGFSKDTIYEGSDSVHLVLEGRDTLYLDSAWIEVVKPANPEQYFYGIVWLLGGFQDFPPLTWGKTRIVYDDRVNPVDTVPVAWPGHYFWLKSKRSILGDPQVSGGLKAEQTTPPSNQLILRSIFRSKNLDYDTLILIGDYRICPPACLTNEIRTKTLNKRSAISKQKKIQVNGRRLKESQK